MFRCARAFSDASNFRRHVKIVHDKEKQYKCNTCGYDCLTKRDMVRHVRSISHLKAAYDVEVISAKKC